MDKTLGEYTFDELIPEVVNITINNISTNAPILSGDMYPNVITIWVQGSLTAEGQPTGWVRTTQNARVSEVIEKKYDGQGVQSYNILRIRTPNDLGQNFMLVEGISTSSEPINTAVMFTNGVIIRDVNSMICGYRYEAKK